MDAFLTQWEMLLLKLSWGISGFFAPQELLSYLNLAGALLCALLALRISRPRRMRILMRRLFPSRLWRHASARFDTYYYLFIQALAVLVLSPLVIGVFQETSSAVLAALEQLFGARSAQGSSESGTLLALLYTLLLFLALDFAFFISHYLQHKWRWLWCFHKVHHSAEVLVPTTAMRFHPIDMLWNMAFAFGLSALMSGVCQYLFYHGQHEWLLFGNNLFVALSYITTHNLRHSHIWLHYPRWLSRWLISPVQHQIHHSIKPEHVDTNFGYLFAGWDRLFGTLVIPEAPERIRVGVIENGALYTGHRTLRGLLAAPFKEAWELLKPARHSERSAAAEESNSDPSSRERARSG